jgi:hypothetical protein
VDKPDFSEEYIYSIFRFEEKAKQQTNKKQRGFLLGLLFDPYDGGYMFLWRSGIYLNYTALQLYNHTHSIHTYGFRQMFQRGKTYGQVAISGFVQKM